MQNNYWLIIKSFFCSFLLFFVACSDDDIIPSGSSSGSSNTWVIPESELEFGANKDAIRAVDTPAFSMIDSISYIEDDDRLLVLKLEGEIRAYSLNVLNWHEIINDQIAEKNIAITYCPLTGTGVCWNREINGALSDFGVSGWLYNSNLIAFDRTTDSYWSQMRMDCIHGEYIGKNAQTFQMVEMPLSTLKIIAPEAQVLNTETGFNLPYLSYPYYDYRTNNDFFVVPVEFDDDRLSAKEEVLGIIVQDEAKVYPFSVFPQNQLTVINEVFKGQPVVIACHPEMGFATAFKANLDGETLTFNPETDQGAIILSDSKGNKWTIFGEAVEGPYAGKQLKTLDAFTGYWFAWALFFPRVEIYE